MDVIAGFSMVLCTYLLQANDFQMTGRMSFEGLDEDVEVRRVTLVTHVFLLCSYHSPAVSTGPGEVQMPGRCPLLTSLDSLPFILIRVF